MSSVKSLVKHQEGAANNVISKEYVNKVKIQTADGKVFNLPANMNAIATGNWNDKFFTKHDANVSNLGTGNLGGVIEFILPKQNYALLDSLRLHMKASTASTGVPLSPMLQINEVEVLQDGILVQRIFGRELLMTSRLSKTHHELQSSVDFDGDHRRDVTGNSTLIDDTVEYLGTAEQYESYVPIKCCITDAKLAVKELIGEIRLKFTLNNQTVSDSDATPTTAIDQPYLECGWQRLNQDTYNRIVRSYKNDVQHWRITQVREYQLGTANTGTTASLYINQPLVAAALLFSLKASTSSSRNSYTNLTNFDQPEEALAISTATFKDESGENLLHNRANITAIQNSLFSKVYFPENYRELNTGFSLYNSVLYSACSNIPASLQSGAELGWREFSGKEIVELNNQSGTNAMAIMHALQLRILRVANGKMELKD
jgi:hypothetical protein